MRRPVAIVASLLVLLAMTACIPCECKEATLVGVPGVTLKIAFDSSINPFSKDTFTVTVIQAGESRTIHGTYEKSGDTIRFDVNGAVPFLSIKSGEINALACDKPRDGQFTVTPPAPPGGTAVPLTFQCTKKA